MYWGSDTLELCWRPAGLLPVASCMADAAALGMSPGFIFSAAARAAVLLATPHGIRTLRALRGGHLKYAQQFHCQLGLAN